MLNLEKQGYLHLYAERPAINTSASVMDAAAIANRQNTADYLKQTFFTPNPSILSMHELENGGQTTLMIPSGPYAEGAVMVIAKGPHSLDREGIQTETIYDYPDDVQNSYWMTIYSSLQACNELAKEKGRDGLHVVASENCIATRTNAVHRTSRSIALPHSQIFTLDEQHITPFDEDEEEINHLVFEQQALQQERWLKGYTQLVQGLVVNKMRHGLEGLRCETKAPFGYSFIASYDGAIEEITQVMNAHHQAYTEAAELWVPQLKPSFQEKISIPQPSYRLYMSSEDGNFQVTVSPEFLSHAGVLEAAGVELKRGPQYPRRISEEQMAQDRAYIRDAVVTNLEVYDEEEVAVVA